MPTVQGRFWCFTLNNPTVEENETFIDLACSHTTDSVLRYMVYQHESGEQGTSHLQGYCEFTAKRTVNQIKQFFKTTRLHLEIRRGTQQQAIDYCKKEDSRIDGPYEIGTPSKGQGERNDLNQLKEILDKGATEKEVADTYFPLWCKHNRAICRYKVLSLKPRNFKTKVSVIVGPPGTGKSRWVFDKTSTAYWKQHGKWWCGYEGHNEVVLDDFYGWLPWNLILRICDRYPLLVENKQGQAQFTAKEIYITSNTHPKDWYHRMPIAALTRRVETWIYMGYDNVVQMTDNYEEFDRVYNNLTHVPATVPTFRTPTNSTFTSFDYNSEI